MPENNNKYLSWGFIKKLGLVLAVIGSVYLWIDAKLETKLDREVFKALMTQQTESLGKISLNQEEVARQLHNIDIRLVKIETNLSK